MNTLDIAISAYALGSCFYISLLCLRFTQIREHFFEVFGNGAGPDTSNPVDLFWLFVIFLVVGCSAALWPFFVLHLWKGITELEEFRDSKEARRKAFDDIMKKFEEEDRSQ